MRRVDGTLGWILSRATPLFDAKGEIAEWFGAATDVTARKTAKAEREHLLRELARSNEHLSQFARAASHDLKAPLSTILQFSQFLLNRDTNRKFLMRARKSTWASSWAADGGAHH